MLRDGIPHNSGSDGGARYEAIRRGTGALLQAKLHFESLLADNDAWHALMQSQAGGRNGGDIDAGDAGDARTLRERLTRELAAEPAFIAWQFVEAALACLALDQVPAAAPFVVATANAANLQAVAPDATEAPTATGPRGLASRIPTLEPSDRHDAPEPAPEPANALPYADDSTRFTAAAVGIEEAQVKIVVRAPTKPLIDLSLPPLPFARNGPAAEERTSRAEQIDGEPIFHRGESADEADIAIVRGRPGR